VPCVQVAFGARQVSEHDTRDALRTVAEHFADLSLVLDNAETQAGRLDDAKSDDTTGAREIIRRARHPTHCQAARHSRER